MTFLYSIIGFLLAIGILVAVHEFGHYWVAKKLGVKVLRFSIGFGKPLYSYVGGADRTEYVLAAIPLGGYVKMLDEMEGEVSEHEQHRAFNQQPIWKRSLIVLAGPGINFLFAIMAFFAIGMMPSQSLTPMLGEVPEESLIAKAGINPGDQLVAIDGRPYQYFGQHDLYVFNQVLKGEPLTISTKSTDNIEVQGTETKATIHTHDLPIYNISPAFLARTIGLVPAMPPISLIVSRVVPGSPAEQVGLQEGDEILAINRSNISNWSDLVAIVSQAAGQTLELEFRRGNETLSLSVVPESAERNGQTVGLLGIAPTIGDYPESAQLQIKLSPWQAFHHGLEQTWLMSVVTVRMFWKMLTLQVSHKNINGPITIAEVTGKAIQVSLDYYLHILAVISISLGVINLLPIPMLDGGHLVMYAIEVVAGKTVAEKVFFVGQRFGILLLAGLMTLAFYNDIFRLIN